MSSERLSIIVPALNEEGNIKPLVERINTVLSMHGILYEIIIIDDYSTDATVAVAQSLQDEYPVRVFTKQGSRGKAFSIIEGFLYAQFELVSFIDADLQYPPEAFIEMIEKIEQGSDIIVANRLSRDESRLRNFVSKLFANIFARYLHGVTCDVQSGMKVFRREVACSVSTAPSAWTFDLEFIVNAVNIGFTVDTVDIEFKERLSGDSKISIIKASFEIGWNALKVKFRKRQIANILPYEDSVMLGAGVAHKKKQYITHTTLPSEISALEVFTSWQKVLLFIAVSVVIVALIRVPLLSGIIIVGTMSVAYFIDAFFGIYLVNRSLRRSQEYKFNTEELQDIEDEQLPMYTILCPMYREAAVIGTFLKAIDSLDWPKDKLDVLLLLEEKDTETKSALDNISLPSYVRVISVPESQPKTKPKACNYGLEFTKGKYVVIYDAEDKPEPQQLKKAYNAFQRVPENVACLQAKLNYFNPDQNLITRLFTAEYSLWYEVTLPGLQSMNTYIPLGGTSNHFRADVLRQLRGWDPFNVTEDCDLGIRLFNHNYRTAVIDSVTLEEANSSFINWLRQRSRWIKGYMQTYLVHTRRPFDLLKKNPRHALTFHFLVGGKMLFALINPLLWLLTISYFAFNSVIGPTIEKLYPEPILLIALFSLVIGNFSYLFYYMIGLAKRGHWKLIKFVFLVPIYWLMTSIASYIALYQLFVKPHFWEKTQHGLHLPKVWTKPANAELPVSAGRFTLYLSRFRSSVSGVVGEGGMLITAMMVANGLNLLFNAMIGRMLSFETLSVVIFINTLWLLATIFINPLSSVINHTTSYLVSISHHAVANFLSLAMKRALVATGLFTVAWFAALPFITSYFKLDNSSSLILFSPIFTFGVIASANAGYLQGKLLFKSVGIIMLTEATTKLIAAIVLLSLNLSQFIYISIPLSVIFSGFISLMIIRREKPTVDKKIVFSFPNQFYLATLVANVSAIIFLSLDIMLAKHYLTPELAGQYSLLSLIGKMMYFFGSIPNIFMLTLVARNIGLKKSTRVIFMRIFAVSASLIGIGFIILGPLGPYILPYIFGEKVLMITAYLNKYTAAIAFFTLSTVIVSYHLANKQYIYPILSLASSLILTIGLSQIHSSLNDFTHVIFIAGASSLAMLLTFHALERYLPFLRVAVHDFLDTFATNPNFSNTDASTKKILVFNWRDTKHVFAGGAEIYTHEIAKRFIEDGHSVTMFCGNDGRSKRNETIDGINIIRRGGFYFVYVWAFIYYIFKFRNKFDIIIDCHNGIPFFTPFFARIPVYCLMHHVHQEVFRRSLSKPSALFAQFLERDVMRLVYYATPFITVSESSKKGIEALKLGRAGITVINPGVDIEELVPDEKSPVPAVLYLGRLKAYKSVHVVIESFKQVLERVPEARLIIAGDGEELDALKVLSKSLNIENKVRFLGKVTEDMKLKLFQKAWVLVNPSLMEGWAITTIEANSCGTPIVASDVPGLRDSVIDSVTGHLVPYNDVLGFTERITEILANHELRSALNNNAYNWSRNFSWNATSSKFLSVIVNYLEPVQNRFKINHAVTASIVIVLITVFASASSGLAFSNINSSKLNQDIEFNKIEEFIETETNLVEISPGLRVQVERIEDSHIVVSEDKELSKEERL